MIKYKIISKTYNASEISHGAQSGHNRQLDGTSEPEEQDAGGGPSSLFAPGRRDQGKVQRING